MMKALKIKSGISKLKNGHVSHKHEKIASVANAHDPDLLMADEEDLTDLDLQSQVGSSSRHFYVKRD